MEVKKDEKYKITLASAVNYIENRVKTINCNKAIFTFLCTILGLFFYGIGYLFLYGYYFGGKTIRIYSIIDILADVIPLNFKPILMVGVTYFVIVAIFYIMSKMYDKHPILIILIGVFTHMIIATFFIGIGGTKLLEYMFFGIVWIFPILILEFIKYLKIAQENSLVMFSSLFYCPIAIVIIYQVKKFLGLDKEIVEYIRMCLPIISLSILMISSSFLNNIKKSKLKYYLLNFFPMFLVLGFLFTLCLSFLLKIKSRIFLYLMSFTIASFLTILGKNKIENILYKNHKIIIDKNSNKVSMDKFDKGLYTTFIVLILSIFSITVVMYGAILSGNIVRTCTVNRPKAIIKYTANGKTKEIEGKIVAKKENLLYISNKEYKLLILKANEFEAFEMMSIDDIIGGNDDKWLKDISTSYMNFYQLDDDEELEILIMKDNKVRIIDRGANSSKIIASIEDVYNVYVNNKIIKVMYNNKKEESYKIINGKLERI